MATYIGSNARISDSAIISDNAYIYGDARIYGNARISGTTVISDNAIISGIAYISGDAIIKHTHDYITIGPAISSNRYTTAYRDSVIGIRVNTGCFSGSIQEFIDAINSTHANNPAAHAQYMAFVALINAHFAACDSLSVNQSNQSE